MPEVFCGLCVQSTISMPDPLHFRVTTIGFSTQIDRSLISLMVPALERCYL